MTFVPPEGVLGQRLSNLGVEMLGGAVIAFAFGWIEQRIEHRQEDAAERQRLEHEKAAERQRLQLTLGLQQDLTGIGLARADLSGFYLRGKILKQADLTGANLTGANLIRADLTGANLDGADLSGANLRVANLTEARLREANLDGTDLTETNLSEADLTGANLTMAYLMDANLYRAYLVRANLTGARVNSYTRWPESFNPRAAGLTFVAEPRNKDEQAGNDANPLAPEHQESTPPPSDVSE